MMVPYEQTLADLLASYMQRRGYGDHKLATLANKYFPELQLSRSNIRNWREGKSNTVRYWPQMASIAYALDLTEQEANQLFQLSVGLDMSHLRQTAAAEEKKYLDKWHTSESSDENVIAPVQLPSDTSLIEREAANQPESSVTTPVTNSFTKRNLLLFSIPIVLFLVLTSYTLLPFNQETPDPVNRTRPSISFETRTPSPLETNGIVSFEQDSDVSIWQWETTCTYARLDASQAHTGKDYLAVAQDPSSPCRSFSQRLSIPAEPGEVIRFGGWISSPENTTIEGHLELLIEPLQANEKAFTVSSNLWHCQELAFVVPDEHAEGVEVRVRLDSQHPVTYHFDDLQLKRGNETICPPTIELPWIDSLEEATMMWQSTGLCEIARREAYAYSGTYFLAVDTVNPECNSIRRDFLQFPLASQAYYAAAWVRVPGEEPTWGELVLATGNDPVSLHGINEQSGTQFIVYGNKWQCIETVLSVESNNSNTLRVQLAFNSVGVEYHIDHVQISNQSICENYPLTDLENGDFEDTLGRISWKIRFTCGVSLLDEPDMAQSGQQFLQVEDPGDGCFSIFQELHRSPQVGQTYYLSAWVRAGDGLPWNGEIVIWALGDQVDKSTFRFLGSADTWQCVETALTIKYEGHNQLQPEIYQHAAGRHTFYVDNVRFTDTPQCFHRDEGLVQNLVQYISGPVFSGATVAVAAEISNKGFATATGSISYWVSDSENGESINGEMLTEFLPPPVAGQEVWTFYEDVYLPIGLVNGNYYIVLEPHITVGGAEVEGSGTRVSLPVTVSECLPGPLYCDLPGDYWAWPELNSWFEQGISRGCRSQTEIYVNRPFCPDMVVSRAVLGVFLLRQLYGGGFQPIMDYRGLFVDVSADHQWVLWIEAFQDTDFTLPSSDCVVTGTSPIFCPDKPVSRGELAVYLAEILGWVLPSAAVTPFTDVSGNSLEARAIAYMWEHGFIADNEPDCDTQEAGRQFCPNEALRRVHAAVYLSRAFAAEEANEP